MNVVSELEHAGALIRGKHFVLTHGDHSPDFVRIDALVSKPRLLGEFCTELAQRFVSSGAEIVTACTDDRCSLLASLCAEALGIQAGTAEDLEGRTTLIVEDALTTGGSVIDIRRQAESYGAKIIGVGVIWNRRHITNEQLGVPLLEALTDVELESFVADQCGLCVEKVPIVGDVGKGDLFRLDHPDYLGGYQDILTN